MSPSEKARYIIGNNWLLTIASSDEIGRPHISPVGYAYDDKLNLYWVSNKDAAHSKNIQKRKQIETVIVGELPDGSTDGVYYEAEAEEMKDESEIMQAIKLMQKRDQDEKFKIKSINDVTGNAVWRIYRARPIKIYKRADKILRGQSITIRQQIKL